MLDLGSIKLIKVNEPGYHHTFYTLKNKLKFIYYLGDLTLLDRKVLGVVGPRQASIYAVDVMKDFFQSIAEYDLATISGGAKGIDTLCHELSLQYHIPTIMVLGAGFSYYLDHPRTRELCERIVTDGGLLLSQFPHDQEGSSRTYPARNKIVAGLSKVLFVPAAGKKSGSLLTVDYTVELGKPVYTVPNSIYDPTSEGTNTYIETGKVHAITSFGKVLATHFGKTGSIIEPGEKKEVILTSDEQKLIELLAQHPLEVGELCEKLERPIQFLMGSITGLELKGLIEEAELGTYKLAK